MTKPVKRRKKANIGPKNRGTNRLKKHRQQQFMDESQRSEGAAAFDTQELLKTPSPDSSKVDDEKMFAALESEGMFHHN